MGAERRSAQWGRLLAALAGFAVAATAVAALVVAGPQDEAPRPTDDALAELRAIERAAHARSLQSVSR